MVRPIVKCAAPVWDPHTLVNINKLLIYLYHSPEDKSTTFYKIINGHLVVPTVDLSPNLPSLRSGYYHQPITLIDADKFSFFLSVVKLWNQLPVNVVNSPTLTDFCNN